MKVFLTRKHGTEGKLRIIWWQYTLRMKREMPAVHIGHIDVFPLFRDISHENDIGDFHPYGPAI